MKKAGQGSVMLRPVAGLAICGLVMAAALAWSASQPIYDEHADARRDITSALAQASKTGRNIVLIFGANW